MEKMHNKLVLTMIVKNESQILLRCLESARPHVHAMVVCDTGSSDNTMQMVRDYFVEKKVNGYVYSIPWRGFGPSRTESFEKARRHGDYVLLLDADMVLRADQPLPPLKEAGYMLEQFNGNLRYWNCRILSTKYDWTCKGRTHEYWSCPDHYPVRLTEWNIDDRNDGGCKADKFTRDVELLQKDLEENPNDPRTMFYLANSLHAVGRKEEAISFWRKRVECKDAFAEEKWRSLVSIADALIEIGKDAEGIATYLEAYNFRPTRAESLYRLALYYRFRSKNTIAYSLAKIAEGIPYPKDDILFVNREVYEWKVREEISINAFYVAKKEEGLRACEGLILSHKTPESARWQAVCNRPWYTPTLSKSQQVVKWDTLNLHKSYIPTSSSMIFSHDGQKLICNVRLVNYTLKGSNYTPMNGDTVIRTENIIVELDPTSRRELRRVPIDTHAFPSPYDFNVKGWEDIRLFWSGKRLFASFTDCERIEGERRPQICLAELNPDTYSVLNVVHLAFHPELCQKNWMPFNDPQGVYPLPRFVYGWNPITVIEANPLSGVIRTVYESGNLPINTSTFRGGTQMQQVEGGWLGCIHEVSIRHAVRAYVHRWILLDSSFQIRRWSNPFFFVENGVEFTCGFTPIPDTKQVLIGCSVWDRNGQMITAPSPF